MWCYLPLSLRDVISLCAAVVLVVIMKKKKLGPWRDKDARAIHYLGRDDPRLGAEGQTLIDQNRRNGAQTFEAVVN